jgi:hypothetical protein
VNPRHARNPRWRIDGSPPSSLGAGADDEGAMREKALEKKEERKRKAGRGLCILFHRAPALKLLRRVSTRFASKAIKVDVVAARIFTLRTGFEPALFTEEPESSAPSNTQNRVATLYFSVPRSLSVKRSWSHKERRTGCARVTPVFVTAMSRMPHHVAVAALVLCVISGTVSASDPVAQMAGMASKDAFASHEHSPAFLGFMSKHDKKYCDGIVACEVSILREKIFNLNQEFVNVHNSNPGACPGMREPRSIEAGRVNTPELTHAASGSRFPTAPSP